MRFLDTIAFLRVNLYLLRDIWTSASSKAIFSFRPLRPKVGSAALARREDQRCSPKGFWRQRLCILNDHQKRIVALEKLECFFSFTLFEEKNLYGAETFYSLKREKQNSC